MGKRDKDKKLKAKAAAQKSKETKDESKEEVDGEIEEIQEGTESMSVSESSKKEKEISKYVESPRLCTGVNTSLSLSRDLKIENFSLSLYGQVLITDTKLEFNWGRRYGLLGFNGSGKSTLLTCLGQREVPIPPHFNIYHLDREADATDLTPLEYVLADLEGQRIELEKEAEDLASTEAGSTSERLMDIYASLDEMDIATAPQRAGQILHGLGFNKVMQAKKTRDFSGGWRMRIALAKALFVCPNMLLLDEPTNHLDLEACVWLEEYLKTYNRILVLISHSQDFMNNVCTNIIQLQNKNLVYYSGNYDSYIKARAEKEENQMKLFNWEQEQIAHMKEYIARFGHGSAKLARQAQSKEKTLEKMKEKGLTEKVVADKILQIRFMDCGKLPPPVLTFNKVSFAYPGTTTVLYKDLEFGVDLDSRIALVGPNGVGKSTLLKLMTGDNLPTNGSVRRHNHLKIGYYHQHLTDQLDPNLSPLEYMMKCYENIELPAMRSIVGRFGITGKTQTLPINSLSDGQKSRVVLAWLAYQQPHLLLLDEPTNHLDMETIDSLADAINHFEGGLVLVSHDFRLISQVAQEIWVCEGQGVHPWKGSILDYKKLLKSKMDL